MGLGTALDFGTEASVRALSFHAVLQSDIFLDLPEKAVRIDVGVESRNRALRMNITATVKVLISALSAPWLDCGVITLGLASNPDLSPATVSETEGAEGGGALFRASPTAGLYLNTQPSFSILARDV